MFSEQVFHEFVNTEGNYVAILECISKISSEAEDPSQQGGALLDEQEMKIIFGSMPPILKYVCSYIILSHQIIIISCISGFMLTC